MSQPVKLSDALVLEARIAGAAMERSIAGQVEFWAKIGKAVERLASGGQLARINDKAAVPLSEVLATIHQPAGRKQLDAYLNTRPFPRFSAHPELADTFILEDADGRRTIGRFVGGEFEPLLGEAGGSA